MISLFYSIKIASPIQLILLICCCIIIRFREWTGNLDEHTKYVKQQFVEYVTKFYEDGDQNIVQVRKILIRKPINTIILSKNQLF